MLETLSYNSEEWCKAALFSAFSEAVCSLLWLSVGLCLKLRRTVVQFQRMYEIKHVILFLFKRAKLVLGYKLICCYCCCLRRIDLSWILECPSWLFFLECQHFKSLSIQKHFITIVNIFREGRERKWFGRNFEGNRI